MIFFIVMIVAFKEKVRTKKRRKTLIESSSHYEFINVFDTEESMIKT